MARSVGVITKTQADRCGNAVRRWYRSEVELSEDELEPLVNAISDWRQTHAHPLSLVTPGVRNWVSREASGDVIVGQRLKRLDRIVDKLARFPTMRLSQMEDVGGCRAVLATPTAVEAVAARIRRKWEVTTTSDYREAAKPTTGYRGLHIVALRRERLVEIQLRTEREQYWAEVVERTSSRTGFALKDGEGPPSLLRYFEVASTLGWADEYELPVDRSLLDELAALREQVRPYFSSNPAADV